jgi:rubrerythrin
MLSHKSYYSLMPKQLKIKMVFFDLIMLEYNKDEEVKKMNAIDFMISTEEDGLRLYETLSQEATDMELKEIFSLLADSQNKHLASLETLKKNLSKTDIDSMTAKGSNTINGFRKLLNKRHVLGMLKNDQDAFWHVVTTEEEIIRTLEGIASAEPQEEMRRVLERIVSDEKEHLSKIENIYEFIETPHSFLEWGEFPNLHPL